MHAGEEGVSIALHSLRNQKFSQKKGRDILPKGCYYIEQKRTVSGILFFFLVLRMIIPKRAKRANFFSSTAHSCVKTYSKFRSRFPFGFT